MTEKKNISQKASALRKLAEDIARKKTSRIPEPEDMGNLSPEKTQQILHELRVHQIELEMQNEELRISQVNLDAARARYFDLYDLAPVGYCTIGEKDLILEANLTIATLLGIPRKELLKKPITRFIFKDDQSIYHLYRKQLFETDLAFRQDSLLQDSLRQGSLRQGSVKAVKAVQAVEARSSHVCEIRMLKKYGTVFWVRLDAAVAQAEDGTSVCHMTISDITEGKQIDNALKESEKRYRRIMEEITDYVYTVTVCDGRAVETKHEIACEFVTGYNAKDFSENPLLWINMVPPEEREMVVKHGKEILAGKELPAIEHRIVRKDGKIRWISDKAVLHFDSHKVLESYEGVIHDITDRKQADEALRESEERYRNIFAGIPDGVIIHDANGVILDANETMIQRLELSRDAILGRKIAKFVTHDKAFSVDDNAATALMGKLLIFETNYVSASGKTIPAEVYEHRIPWGGVSAVLSISRDITARKNSEVMLTLAYRELELAHNKLLAGRQLERLAFTGRIAASIAHEIRNPSTNASLALSQLCSTSKLEEKQVKYLEIIEKNINRINYLIDEMLNCARPPELNVKPHDIHEILNTVCESVELKMTAMKIKLVKEFTTADAMVNVDREQIGRVFLNLIINAIDAMSRNGGILTIVTETDGESFMIRINDIGKGMSADEIIKIFDPFFTTKTSGIGLGLTTCHGVVVSHGGSIKVTSEVSKGTTFTVTLPEL